MRKPWKFKPGQEKFPEHDVLDFIYPLILDYTIPEVILEDLKNDLALSLKYPHREPEVQTALSKYLGCSPDMILPIGGGNGALDLISKTFLQNKKVSTPIPTFWQIVEAPSRYNSQCEFPDICADQPFEEIMKSFLRCDAIILCSPNNPMGTNVPHMWVEELLRISEHRVVIVDETYADMASLTQAKFLGHPNLILMRSLKIFLLPGVRAGYIAAHPSKIDQLSNMKPPFDTSVTVESALLSVMKHLSLLQTIWNQVAGDRALLKKQLLNIGGDAYESETPFVCWRHPMAAAIADGLRSQNIFVLCHRKPVIVGMNPDMLRITVRKPDIQKKLLAAVPSILEGL